MNDSPDDSAKDNNNKGENQATDDKEEDRIKSVTNKSHSISMADWFEKHASDAEADAMIALQLDYRFHGDNFGSMWWIHFQRLGFKHVERHYQLPTSFPEEPKKLYGSNEIYHELDALAIPQVTSAFDEMPRAATTTEWWRTIRDELIFRNFQRDIEKECQIRKQEPSKKLSSNTKSKNNNIDDKKSSSSFQNPSMARRQQTTLSTRPGAAQDAELYIVKTKKKKRGRSSDRSAMNSRSQDDSAPPLEFLSFLEYTQAARKQVDHRLWDDACRFFEEWRFLVSTNHSLLLYGAGSKFHLLRQFANDELDKDGDVVELNGYDKSISIESILDLLVDHWFAGKDPSVDLYHVHYGGSKAESTGTILPLYPLQGDTYVVQRAVAIAKRVAAIVETTFRPVYLVLHNIDGPALRNPTAQEALSVLISESMTRCGWNAIRLVASVDHVNAPTLLWDSSTSHRFHWIWKEFHTQQPYVEEVLESTLGVENTRNGNKKPSKRSKLSSDEGLFNDEDPAVQRESVFSVLKSLASRHTQALQQLAWLQLESKKDWITYMDLLNQCRLKCVVTHDTQLRSYLGELMDHHIVIRNASEAASATSYRIPYPADMLDLILDYEPDA
jgi:Origin recognition complex subunit 2